MLKIRKYSKVSKQTALINLINLIKQYFEIFNIILKIKGIFWSVENTARQIWHTSYL